jgi:hypothetical protein
MAMLREDGWIMVEGMATRLQEENRELHEINAELVAALHAALHGHKGWDDEARAAIARAEALGISQ